MLITVILKGITYTFSNTYILYLLLYNKLRLANNPYQAITILLQSNQSYQSDPCRYQTPVLQPLQAPPPRQPRQPLQRSLQKPSNSSDITSSL
jgi:hypothetical protein